MAFRDMSVLHRVVVSQLLVAVSITEFIRPNRPDSLIEAVLAFLKIGLVTDCIAATTGRLRRLSRSNGTLDWMLHQTPFVTGPSMELTVAILALRNEKASMAQRFLVGSGYVKTLAVGGLCLVVHAFRPKSRPDIGAWSVNWAATMRFAGIGGLLVLISGPTFGGEGQWTFRMPLFLVLHIAFVYYAGNWYNIPLECIAEKTDDHKMKIDNGNGSNSADSWIFLLSLHLALKLAAFWLVKNLLTHLRSLETPYPDANAILIEFIILPLACTMVDHSTHIRITLEGNIAGVWFDLIQSTLQTYFLTRPLAALSGLDVDPVGGRIGFGACLLVTAAWLSIPSVPRIFQGMLLMLAYSFILYTCVVYPDFIQRYVF